MMKQAVGMMGILLLLTLAAVPATAQVAGDLDAALGGFVGGSAMHVGPTGQGIAQTANTPAEGDFILTLFADYSHGDDYDDFPEVETTDFKILGGLGYGVTDQWMVGAVVPFYHHMKLDNRRFGMNINGAEVDSIGDLSLFTKYRFYEENDLRLAIYGEVRVPTGEDDLALSRNELANSTGDVGAAVNFTGSYRIDPAWELHGTVGYRFDGGESDSSGVTYSAAIDYNIRPDLTLFVSAAGHYADFSGGMLQIGPGAAYRLTDDIALTGQVAFGVTDPTPEIRALGGISVRFSTGEKGPNQPPTAVITAEFDRFTNNGAVYRLSGAESSDPDGRIVEYLWSVEGEEHKGRSVRVTFVHEGPAAVALRVKDNDGATDDAAMRLEIEIPRPAALIEMELRGQNRDGATYVLDGSRSFSEGAEIVDYSWTVNGEEFAGEEIRYTFPGPSGETYRVELTVTDSRGLTASTAEMVVVELPDIPHTIIPEDRRIILQSMVLFDFDSARLRPDGIEALKPIGYILQEYPQVEIDVEGYASSEGTEEYNLGLSQRRANAVRSHLIDVYGIRGSRLKAIGFGESNPRVDNDTEEHRAMNRRVEFKIEGDI